MSFYFSSFMFLLMYFHHPKRVHKLMVLLQENNSREWSFINFKYNSYQAYNTVKMPSYQLLLSCANSLKLLGMVSWIKVLCNSSKFKLWSLNFKLYVNGLGVTLYLGIWCQFNLEKWILWWQVFDNGFLLRYSMGCCLQIFRLQRVV